MTETEQHVSRRSVVRVGANAAWAVPAIAIIGAAPAIACSAGQATAFTVSGATTYANIGGSLGTQKRATGIYTVKNPGKPADARLTLRSSSILVPASAPTVSGWAFEADISGFGGARTYTYVKTAACGDVAANFTFNMSRGLASPTITMSVATA